MVLSATIPDQLHTWLDVWSRWPEREPSAHPGYLMAIASADEQPMCAVLDLGESGVIYPFLTREIDLPPMSGACRDITGPLFGYTGAFEWNIKDKSQAAERFWSEFAAWARQARIVSSFARLSLFEDDLLPFDGRTRVVQPNVIRDLQHSDDELWRDVEHKVRKNVKHARAEGVVVETDPNWDNLDSFIAIYEATMRRRQATPRYSFPHEFFEKLVAAIPGSLQLFLARVGSKVISAELVLTSTHHAYSFLGGTREESFRLRPNDLLKYEIIRALRDQGLTHLVLGGGPTPGDGIFRYKRSFAPNGLVDFKVGEQIYDPGAYEELIQQHSAHATADGRTWRPIADFFPAYRAG